MQPTKSAQRRIRRRYEVPRISDVRRSEDPYLAVWRELERYSGSSASERAIQGRNHLNAGFAKELRYCIRNADLFFKSYYDADTLIEPVLLYYAAMWLSSALIYVEGTDGQVSYWRDQPQHGVKARFKKGSFLDAHIEFFDRGTVQSTSRVLAGDWICKESLPIMDLLRTLPDLEPQLNERSYTLLPIPVHVTESEMAHIFPSGQIQYIGKVDFERDIVVSPALHDRDATVQPFEEAGIVFWNWRGKGLDDINSLTIQTGSGRFFERRFASGHYLPEMAVHLALLHALSDFARYRPEIWIKMADDHNDDYAIIREYIHVAERRLPNIALNELSRRIYMFTQS